MIIITIIIIIIIIITIIIIISGFDIWKRILFSIVFFSIFYYYH